MAKMFKVTDLYLVDVNDWYNNGEEVAEDIEDNFEYLFTATDPKVEQVDFEWDDNHVFNTFGCSPIDCEMWFQYYKHQKEEIKNETTVN